MNLAPKFSTTDKADEEKDVVKIAKKLKKEKVNIDIVSFGEDEVNNEKLANFINTLNGSEGSRFEVFYLVF